MGRRRAEVGVRVAVEVPLTSEAAPASEDGECNHLAGTQRRIGAGTSLFLREGVAEVVHHDVQCGEEGVHVDHESVPFLSGNGIGKPTLDHGHLPLKIRTVNSHQALTETVAEKIAAAVLERHILVEAVRVKVTKPDVRLGQTVLAGSAVEIVRRRETLTPRDA